MNEFIIFIYRLKWAFWKWTNIEHLIHGKNNNFQTQIGSINHLVICEIPKINGCLPMNITTSNLINNNGSKWITVEMFPSRNRKITFTINSRQWSTFSPVSIDRLFDQFANWIQLSFLIIMFYVILHSMVVSSLAICLSIKSSFTAKPLSIECSIFQCTMKSVPSQYTGHRNKHSTIVNTSCFFVATEVYTVWGTALYMVVLDVNL